MQKNLLQGTDQDWERLGSTDPYWAVLTNSEFKRENLGEAQRVAFFASGEEEVRRAFETIHRVFGEQARPVRGLDFGCGVGRLTLPLAQRCDSVLGLDVSASMLAEARKNAGLAGTRNVEFAIADDQLSATGGTFDFIVSHIVFQHIPPERGWVIYKRLLELLRPGGFAAIQILYSKGYFEDSGADVWINLKGIGAHSPRRAWLYFKRTVGAWWRDRQGLNTVPVMQMFPYNLNPLLHACQGIGVHSIHMELTDHGGEFGVVMYLRKPSS